MTEDTNIVGTGGIGEPGGVECPQLPAPSFTPGERVQFMGSGDTYKIGEERNLIRERPKLNKKQRREHRRKLQEAESTESLRRLLEQGMDVGESTATAFAVTGARYLTVCSCGVLYGHDPGRGFATPEEATRAYIAEFQKYRESVGGSRLYWRTLPRMETWSTGFSIWSRCLITKAAEEGQKQELLNNVEMADGIEGIPDSSEPLPATGTIG